MVWGEKAEWFGVRRLSGLGREGCVVWGEKAEAEPEWFGLRLSKGEE